MNQLFHMFQYKKSIQSFLFKVESFFIVGGFVFYWFLEYMLLNITYMIDLDYFWSCTKYKTKKTMDVLALIIGIALSVYAMANDRLRNLLKLVFSGITTGWLLLFFVPNLQIWEIKDYGNLENYNLFLKSGYCLYSMVMIFVVYFVFYLLLPYLFRNLTNGILEKYWDKYYSEKNKDAKLELWLKRFELIKKIIHFLVKNQYITKKYVFTKMSFVEMQKLMNSNFSVIIHFVLCVFMIGLHSQKIILILGILVLLALSVTLVFIPSIRNHIGILTDVLNLEIQIQSKSKK